MNDTLYIPVSRDPQRFGTVIGFATNDRTGVTLAVVTPFNEKMAKRALSIPGVTRISENPGAIESA